jgi:hypothetical protein
VKARRWGHLLDQSQGRSHDQNQAERSALVVLSRSLGPLALLAVAAGTFGACGKAKTKGYDCPTADQVRYGVTIKCGEDDIVGTIIPSELPVCEEDGQAECVTYGTYRAVDAAALSADTILKGTTVAGIKGQLETETIVEYPTCNQDGQLQCITDEGFPAGNAAGAAEKIVAGEVLIGVSGIGVLGDPEHCISNGQEGCLTDSLYKAIEQSKLAECLSL